jgi:hypothetical protein
MGEAAEMTRRAFLRLVGSFWGGEVVKRSPLKGVRPEGSGDKREKEKIPLVAAPDLTEEELVSFYHQAWNRKEEKYKELGVPKEIAEARPNQCLPIYEIRRNHGLLKLREPQEILTKTGDLLLVEKNPRYDMAIWGEVGLCNVYAADFCQLVMGNVVSHRVDSRGRPVLSGGRELNAIEMGDWLSDHGEKYGWQDINGLTSKEKMDFLMKGEDLVYCVRKKPRPHNFIFFRLDLPFERAGGEKVKVATVGFTIATNGVHFNSIDERALDGYLRGSGTAKDGTGGTYEYEKVFFAHSLRPAVDKSERLSR